MTSPSPTTKTRGRPPKVEKEMDRLAKEFDEFQEQVTSLSQDELNKAPKEEKDRQTHLSTRELKNANRIVLKPEKRINAVNPKTGQPQKFNEKFRKAYEFAMEHVCFIAENHEIIGESIELWTRPFGGMDAEFWKIPVNKPVWGPRHLAEQLTKCSYHKIVMEEQSIVGQDGMGTYTGKIAAKHTVDRLTAHPAREQTSQFMGSSGF